MLRTARCGRAAACKTRDGTLTDRKGNTPLHLACQNASWEMIVLLLRYRVNPLVANKVRALCWSGAIGTDAMQQNVTAFKMLPDVRRGARA